MWVESFWPKLGGVITEVFKKEALIEKATPHYVYETLLDSSQMCKILKAKCEIERHVGGKYNFGTGGTNVKGKICKVHKNFLQIVATIEGWDKKHKSLIKIEVRESYFGDTENSVVMLIRHCYVPVTVCEDVKAFWNRFCKNFTTKTRKRRGSGTRNIPKWVNMSK